MHFLVISQQVVSIKIPVSPGTSAKNAFIQNKWFCFFFPLKGTSAVALKLVYQVSRIKHFQQTMQDAFVFSRKLYFNARWY